MHDRNKAVQFQDVGVGFELPKLLTVSDVSVRILHTQYDHLSHYSEQEQIQNKKSMMRGAGTPPVEIPIAEQVDNIEGDEAANSKQVEEDQRSVRSESRKVMMRALDEMKCLLRSVFMLMCLCQSAASVSSNKEERNSSSKKLSGGEVQMETSVEELTTAVAAGWTF